MSGVAQRQSKRSFSFALPLATPLERVLLQHLDTLPRADQARRLLALAVQGYLVESRLLRLIDERSKVGAVGAARAMAGFRLGAARAMYSNGSGFTGNTESESVKVLSASSNTKPFAFLRSVVDG